MKKVHLLLALSTFLVIGCRHTDRDDHRYPPNSTTTLDVIVNGPYTLVWIPSRPDVITLISPRDADGLHKFYLNDLTEGTDQNVHITLEADGLKVGKKLPIDPYFPPDFIAETDVWKRPPEGDPQKDYLVTIELPVPQKITFVSPLHPVTFEKNRMQSFQATNFVLEYQVAEFGRIRAKSRQRNSIPPLSSSDLQKKYNDLCEIPENGKYFYESCANLRNLLEQCAGKKTAVLFFGVGIPLETQLEYVRKYPNFAAVHAVSFFNLMLQSFPNLADKRLAMKDEVDPRRSDGSTVMLMETSFRPAAPRSRLLPVNAFTAVIDCKAGNLIVTAKTTQ
jgi:hypothetical protein